MFSAASLLTTILLALSIMGSLVEVNNSPITLPIVRRLNVSDGTINLLQQDKARVAAFKDQSLKHGGHGTPAANVGNGYYIAVGIGSPATTYFLIVDTGSSNTWVGAKTPYVSTSTSTFTGEHVAVSYTTGHFSGYEYIDTVDLGNGLTIAQQSIGVAAADTSGNWGNADGILGLGPVGLTKGSLTDESGTTIPTITDNLHNQGTIHREIVSISFEPITSAQATVNGELTFGGTVKNKHAGPITYTPITNAYPSSRFWGIDQSISYGSSLIMSSTAGIVDVGTTFIHIASYAYKNYKSATGGTLDAATGLLLISSAQYAALENLNFNIGGETFSLTPNAQIWPRVLNAYVGGSSNGIYLVVSDVGSPSGKGFDFVNGYPFTERFLTVFDSSRSRIGFANTPYTGATTN
ncbi:aspartic peptidase domain-containing protein [Suillus bovinus]|uniref:aspartic peptidase domain-containing protein n=1 Tax=Suillus bovinus TaxID=48563 RepID=UPI001B85B65E|nr:aspartic peptidase domain-containing protein [Suillus bovinus]KAG2155993.1 aspartic peptidase domain-containing protein [Suillus bovinus]